jgi:hypothetical protein
MHCFQLCIVSYLKNISPFRGVSNLAGIYDIRVAIKSTILSMAEPIAGVVYGDIAFLEGHGFYTWAVTIETPGTNSEAIISREGTARGNRIRFSIPKDRADLRHMFDLASDDEFIVLYKDNNGKQHVFGLPYAPVRFRSNHNSGTEHSNKNGYDCEFYYDGPENMFEYNGAVTVAPGSGAPALVRVNGVVIAQLSPGEILDIDSDFDFDYEIIGASEL